MMRWIAVRVSLLLTVAAANAGAASAAASDAPVHAQAAAPAVAQAQAVAPAVAQAQAASPAPAAAPVDVDALLAHIAALTDSTHGGREIGSPGNAAAGEYIARALKSAGVEPAFGDSYFQPFSAKGDSMRNVAGWVRGSRLPGEVVILGAHYDGLPRDTDGRIRLGADDNASGVAILIETAKIAAAEAREGRGPRRTLLFIAFTGEEAGLLGSNEYVRHPAASLDSTVAMVNLDTVGRLRDEKLMIFGVGTADEFGPMLDGLNLSAGFQLEKIPEDSGSSDQSTFYTQHIPVMHVFTGPHEDYHRSGDTPEKLNLPGMARLVSFTWETLDYLARRKEPLTFRFVAAKRPAGGERTERRVSLGAIPDFAYGGPGVLLSGTMPGSPAERAGLLAGDVILQMGGENIGSLEDLQAALLAHQPGDLVTVLYRRGAQESQVNVTLTERK